jgi:hypothetical protein
MEKVKRITGTWRGTYGYSHPEQLAGRPRVPFTLVIKQGWFGRFTGVVTEDPPDGMPGTGSIQGFFAFPRIEFAKYMPVGYFVSPEGGLITFRDHLAKI